MQHCRMGQIKQVIDHQLIMGVDAEIAMNSRISGTAHETGIDNPGGIGAARLSHPYPDNAVTLYERIVAKARTLGNIAAAIGIAYACSRCVEQKAVIRTFKDVTRQYPLVKGSKAMGAAPGQSDRCAVLPSEENYRLIQETATDRRTRQVRTEARAVPGILQVHPISPFAQDPCETSSQFPQLYRKRIPKVLGGAIVA